MASVVRRIRKAVKGRQGFATRARPRVHGARGRNGGWMRPPGSGHVDYPGHGMRAGRT